MTTKAIVRFGEYRLNYEDGLRYVLEFGSVREAQKVGAQLCELLFDSKPHASITRHNCPRWSVTGTTGFLWVERAK